jgi:large subunit ribosomal protein L5
MSTEQIEGKTNPMKQIRLEKVVLHISVGSSWERLQRAVDLLESLTGQKPVLRKAKKTIRTFGITKGEPIACMITLRGIKAEEFLRSTLVAVDRRVKHSSLDECGNFAFGIEEHLDIPGVKYDPEIGIFGMDVIVSLERQGYRVKRRNFRRSRVGKRALINPADTSRFLEEKFEVEFV